MTLISITGVSGTMGTAAIDHLMADPQNRLRILLRRTRRGRRVFHKTVLEQKWTKMGVLPIRLVKY
jgi:uncharacterized protein YbjT (DUF2867 family)